MPGPFMDVYAASQAFLHSFGEAIRQELQDTGVNVAMLVLARAESDVASEGTKAAAEVAEAAIVALKSGSGRAISARFVSADAQVDPQTPRQRNG